LVTTRWSNAQAKYAIVSGNTFSLASSIAGLTLNATGLSNQVGRNPVAGTIQYHFEYDNRPTPSIGGAISEIVTVSNNNAAQVFAQIPVPGEPFGPVLQDMQTITAKRRSISVEIQMPASTQTTTSSAPNTDSLVSSLAPVSPLGVFLDSDNESYTPNTGRYVRSTTFTWK
jgi:hypothetical protein